MSIGSNIRSLREERKLTQEQLAEKLDVTFQAVSFWERDEYLPETAKLIKLAGIFDVSVSALVEEKHGVFETKDTIYDWEHMKTFVKTTAKNLNMADTIRAVDFAVEAHKGQSRKNSPNTPYIYHPLNMACHALAMGIRDDEIIAGILLHDVVEDCKKTDGSRFTTDDLPVKSEVKEIVRLMSHEKTTDKDRDEVMAAYYAALADNPKAALVKCIDRCNNLTTMSWGLSRERIYRMIRETETYYPALMKAVKDTPEYNDAAFLLKYQIDSMLDIYKRLM